MSFASMHDDYLDPDKHLWDPDIEQPHCTKCGGFLKWDPDKTEPWETKHLEEQVWGEDQWVVNNGTSLIRICTKCKHENVEHQ